MSEQARLSLVELEAYKSQGHGKRAGKNRRFYCPIHGSDNQRSLQLNPENGHFKCYACGAWGYLEENRREWLDKNREERGEKHRWNGQRGYRESERNSYKVTPSFPVVANTDVAKKPETRPELLPILSKLQKVFPGSVGETYLTRRGISLSLAQSYGIGYAKDGDWPHVSKDGWPVRQSKWGRVVFPHTTSTGDVLNLYGRAVDFEQVPKGLRHDHLPGSKGVFNAKALSVETVFVCEGVFDAMSLISASYEDACAIFGIYGLRWDWVKAKRMVFCLDQDSAGKEWQEMAWEAIMRGLEVYWLPPKVYGGHKDLNEVWIATGKIDIGIWK